MGIDVYSEILNEVSQFGTGLLWWCESIEITLEVFRHFSVSSLYVNALENSFFVRVHVSNGGHSEDTESPGASLYARKSKAAEACEVKK